MSAWLANNWTETRSSSIKARLPTAPSNKRKPPHRTAKADLDAATEQLRLLGVDKEHPSGIVNIFAPVSGIITDQQVTNAAGVQGLGSPNPFTISDLSYVWIICDVYENDLDAVHVGEFADIRLNAYPDRVLKGRIDNILPILDPNIRTAKVRIDVPNPGLMRVGMFVTATFYGRQAETVAAAPATAPFFMNERRFEVPRISVISFIFVLLQSIPV